MKTVTFVGESFILDPSGMLVWPDQQMAVVADLHLEKASYFARYGQMLPPQESCETIEKLLKALSRNNCRSLILLGDSFHDAEGFKRLACQAQSLWEQVYAQYEVIWVIGNHDGGFVPPQTQSTHALQLKGITFRHQAVQNAVAEISGHYHPKVSLRLSGARVTRPCFITDKNRMILPAFGTLTGGLDVRSKTIAPLFLTDFTVHLLGEGRVYSIPAQKLSHQPGS